MADESSVCASTSSGPELVNGIPRVPPLAHPDLDKFVHHHPIEASDNHTLAWFQHRHNSSASSGSGSSTGSLTALNGIGSIYRQTEGCALCGAKKAPDGSSVMIGCQGCGTLYCGSEHEAFDKKKHKTMCLTIQTQRFRKQQQLLNEYGAMRRISPPRQSLQGLQLGSEASAFSPVLSGAARPDVNSALKAPNPAPSTSSVPEDDDEIQHIPNPNEKILFKDHKLNEMCNISLQEHMKLLAQTGVAVNMHQAIALRLKYLSEHIVRSLHEYGWAVIDNFIGNNHCEQVYNDIQKLYDQKMFEDGALAGKSGVNKDIRSDEIYWYDSSDQRAQNANCVRVLISMIDSIMSHLSTKIKPYNISGRSRAMIAVYPGNGTKYIKHVDNPAKDGRCITSIYYCNENWKTEAHGGALRLYPSTSREHVDIEPIADRLIFFWSDYRNPHEVQPVYRKRFAITIWYFDQNEKEECRRRQMDKDSVEAVSPKVAKPTPEEKPELAGTLPPAVNGDRRWSHGHVGETHFPESNSFSKNTVKVSAANLLNDAPAEASSKSALPQVSVRVVFGLHPERSLSSESVDSNDADEEFNVEPTPGPERKKPRVRNLASVLRFLSHLYIFPKFL
ncbi:hypothetical protein L596_028021 [Steinernema carpocapsae]|uniref:hypoxia-inducible factor-proline dioxygenase n=1 Tax=Steinernema carpocapsae TaxID=34508 RepID=A0A4U5LX73_STECR|nr:hypothetical protein L596_028021 [Steinernema carpocapsae]